MHFQNYSAKYQHLRMERTDGVLTVTFHTDGGTPVWHAGPALETCEALQEITKDTENQVVILTNAGDAFFASPPPELVGPTDVPHDSDEYPMPGIPADRIGIGRGPGRWVLQYLLEVEVPIIGAIQGSFQVHGEIPLMSDIVLASEESAFGDLSHIRKGMVPGDGAQVFWISVLGWNRAKYFHWMSTTISAEEALQLGVVNEVLPRDQVLPRAHEIAAGLLRIPPLVRRFTRLALTHRMRRLFMDEYQLGYALETLALTKGYGVRETPTT